MGEQLVTGKGPKIERGIKIPEVLASNGSRWRTLFDEMKKGDSVLLSCREAVLFGSAMSQYSKKRGIAPVIRSRLEGKRKRVWRLN